MVFDAQSAQYRWQKPCQRWLDAVLTDMYAPRRRTGGNTTSPPAEKERWAAKATCTDADASQTQRVDGGEFTSFVPEFLQGDAEDDGMQPAERTELPELHSETVSLGLHSSITIFGVPRLSEHLTGRAGSPIAAGETDSDKASASRNLEVVICLPSV